MVEEWVPSSISLKTIEWANVKNSEREVNEKGESLNQQTKGILGQMSENAMGLRGIECEGIWRRANAIEWGEKQGVLQQIGKCEEF